jgi:hypothetical protein
LETSDRFHALKLALRIAGVFVQKLHAGTDLREGFYVLALMNQLVPRQRGENISVGQFRKIIQRGDPALDGYFMKVGLARLHNSHRIILEDPKGKRIETFTGRKQINPISSKWNIRPLPRLLNDLTEIANETRGMLLPDSNDVWTVKNVEELTEWNRKIVNFLTRGVRDNWYDCINGHVGAEVRQQEGSWPISNVIYCADSPPHYVDIGADLIPLGFRYPPKLLQSCVKGLIRLRVLSIVDRDERVVIDKELLPKFDLYRNKVTLQFQQLGDQLRETYSAALRANPASDSAGADQ